MKETASNMSRRNFLRLLATAALCAALSFVGVTTSATEAHAASFTQKCYTISSGNTQVYSNTSLTKKYGTIFGSDEVTLLNIQANYTQVRYPISGGTKTGYVKTSTLLKSTGGNSFKSNMKFTTYRRPGGASYGYVAKGDQVVMLGTSGNYTQIRYPISNGYKFAWAYTSDINNAKKTVNTRVSKLNSIVGQWNGRYWTTNGKASNSKGSTSKYYYGIQCKGFASWVFAQTTGVTYIGQTKSNNYQISYTSSKTSLVASATSATASSAKSAFSRATACDFVQMKRRGSGGPHSAIVTNVSNSGVTVLECNADGKCGVKVNYYSYATWANKNIAFSIYRAK